jgi:hypothetical protein
MTELDQWLPTVMLQWQGTKLQQLWISVLGNREWRDVPDAITAERPPAIAGSVPMEDEDDSELYSDNAIEF